MKSPIFGSALTGVMSTSVPNYWYVSGSFSATTAVTTEANAEIPFPNTFIVNNLYVQVSAAPGTGANWVFTVYKNGSPTALTVTISNTGTSATDSTDNVTFNAGDVISLQSTPSVGTAPTAPGSVYWNLVADSGNSNGYGVILGANMASLNTTLIAYTQIFGGNNASYNNTEGNVQSLIAAPGTLSNMYVQLTGGPGNAKSYAITVAQNGTGGTLGPTLSGAGGTTGNDTTHSLSVAAGDSVSIQNIPSGGPVARLAAWGIQWTPTTNGESIYGFGNVVAPSTTVTQYEQPLGAGRGSYNASENSRIIIPGPYSFDNFYAKIDVAPGVATSRTFTLRQNLSSTALSTVIADLATTGSITGQSVTFTQGQSLDLQSAVSGSVAIDTGGVHIGYSLYIPPISGGQEVGNLPLLGIG